MALQKNIFGQKLGPAKTISSKKSGTAIAGPPATALRLGSKTVLLIILDIKMFCSASNSHSKIR